MVFKMKPSIMKGVIETLKKSHLKRNIIVGVVVVLIISAIILNFTKAKYRVTQSIPLVNGTINYSLPDLNIVGLYIDGEEATELDSSKTYTLDTKQSVCTYKNGTKIENLNISYNTETGGLSISPYTTKGTKCTLYFEEYTELVRDVLLANYPTQLIRNSFSSTVTETTTGTIYYADTSKGRTYYFAGNPTDNWVKFADKYWRIIRINEDGSLRLIYQGTSANETGTGTQIKTSAFNSSYTDNAYVGFKYTTNNVHGTGTNSTILGKLNTWYQDNLSSYADKIDGNAGFCNDRIPYSGTGTGTTYTEYATYNRLVSNKQPSFECSNSSDLFTTSGSSQGNKSLQYPIGLITADEVAFAGGVYGTRNTSYYLYTGQTYWTMSPYYFNGSYAWVFRVYSSGSLSWDSVYGTYGVRPVINLRADVTISGGDGTASNPYVVAT